MFRTGNFHMSDEEFMADLVKLPESESEWLLCDEPPKLMAALLERSRIPTDRKIRLFACAAARLYLSTHPADNCYHNALAVAERFAEGCATADELQRAGREAKKQYRWQIDDTALKVVRHAAYLRTRGHPDSVRYAACYTYFDNKTNSLFLRCIFGNPFRPVTLFPSWFTSTAVALAQQIYDAQDFSPMPILADALQDAGCEQSDILDHCRSAGPHVRGCWVVDQLLGKV